MHNFKIGDKVSFGRPNGEKTVGTVTKVNRTKLIVVQDEVRGTGRLRPAGTPWSVPPSLCTLISSGNVPAKKPARSEADIVAEARAIQNLLSPENLACDGERSPSEIYRVGNVLRIRLRALEAELGRKITELGDGDWLPTNTKSSVKNTAFKAGQKVTFKGPRDMTVVGIVHKVNPKTVTVQATTGVFWRVTPGLLQAA